VDSWNCNSETGACEPTGAVEEADETNNLTHLGGLTVTGENPPHTTIQAEELPIRPAQPGTGE
jgi:hypothetical protein